MPYKVASSALLAAIASMTMLSPAHAQNLLQVYEAAHGYDAIFAASKADAEATRIYAQAFNRDKEFYGFYRRLEAYKQAFGSGGSTMILTPEGDFFRYFNDPSGVPSSKK